MALFMVLHLCTGTVLALDVGTSRVVIGADLDEQQRAQIYEDFGLQAGSTPELIVTNAEERNVLSGLVPEGKIGSVALSCVYIEVLEKGRGLTVKTNNINWCSDEMYVNALVTAGITDARVMISAPFAVSGTAALTGIYKAYEDITGESLSDAAKDAAASELIITGNLSEVFGNADATQLVKELKKLLTITVDMSDDEVREQIHLIAENLNLTITEEQVEQLLTLCRSLEKLDGEELLSRITSLQETVKTVNTVGTVFEELWSNVKSFFASVGNFLKNLFGGAQS